MAHEDSVEAALQGAEAQQQDVLALGRQLAGEDLIAKALHIVAHQHLQHRQLLVHVPLLLPRRFALLTCMQDILAAQIQLCQMHAC